MNVASITRTPLGLALAVGGVVLALLWLKSAGSGKSLGAVVGETAGNAVVGVVKEAGAAVKGLFLTVDERAFLAQVEARTGPLSPEEMDIALAEMRSGGWLAFGILGFTVQQLAVREGVQQVNAYRTATGKH
ncbi:hypothetical protein [Chitiniphilus eburneus]|uniref:hypothetical protein n=1 Tax=Chitiniphilus eburneus TaxID=2571148 RepID=UPI0035D0D613